MSVYVLICSSFRIIDAKWSDLRSLHSLLFSFLFCEKSWSFLSNPLKLSFQLPLVIYLLVSSELTRLMSVTHFSEIYALKELDLSGFSFYRLLALLKAQTGLKFLWLYHHIKLENQIKLLKQLMVSDPQERNRHPWMKTFLWSSKGDICCHFDICDLCSFLSSHPLFPETKSLFSSTWSRKDPGGYFHTLLSSNFTCHPYTRASHQTFWINDSNWFQFLFSLPLSVLEIDFSVHSLFSTQGIDWRLVDSFSLQVSESKVWNLIFQSDFLLFLSSSCFTSIHLMKFTIFPSFLLNLSGNSAVWKFSNWQTSH